MLNKKLTTTVESKLSKTLSQITSGQSIEKVGFVRPQNKFASFKSKSFRLRESDFVNLSTISSQINSGDDRMIYSDSQIIRGMINYVSANLDRNLKGLMLYIKDSS